MKAALEELYASVLNFLMKAHDWYNEGKLSHILHGISQPWHRVNADLVDDIAEKSRRIDQLAIAASQAEIRDMHRILAVIQSQQHLSVTKMDDILNKMACKFKCLELRLQQGICRLMFDSTSCHSVKYHARYQPKSFRPTDVTNTHLLIQCSTLRPAQKLPVPFIL